MLSKEELKEQLILNHLIRHDGLNENEAMFRVLFSKAVDLKRVDPTEEMINYEKYQYDITLYLRNISSRFSGILAKRPKRLLR